MFKLFGGKKDSEKAIPTERVITLSSQGFSEPEIINTLKKEGYNPQQVDKAMKDALKGAAGGIPRPAQPPQEPQRPIEETAGIPEQVPRELELPRPEVPRPEPITPEPPRAGLPPEPRPIREEGLEPPGMPGLPEMPQEEPIPRLGRPSKMEAEDAKKRAIEELAETIIEEKWEEFKGEVSNLRLSIQDLEGRLNSLDQVIKQLQEQKGSEVEKIEKKVDSYRESISEISAKMESIENVVKDSLTPMMQTMRSLSDAVKSLKTKG